MDLTSLPSEILTRVCELGPCESSFALRRVCRLFNNLCAGPNLYSAIIEHGNGLGPRDFPKDTPDTVFDTKWWARLRLQNDRHFTAAAQWALADSKARQWLRNGGKFEVTKPQNTPTPTINVETDHGAIIPTTSSSVLASCLSWLPELVLAGNPAVRLACERSRSLRGEHFTTLLQTVEASRDIDQQWRVCLLRACYGVPYCGHPDDKDGFLYGPFRLNVGRAWPSQLVIDADLRKSLFFYARHEPGMIPQVHAVLALGVVRQRLASSAWVLLRAANGPLLPETFESIPPEVIESIPPELFDVPVRSHLTCVVPYQRTTADGISSAHLEEMMRPEFWEDGEWVGRYDYSLAGVGTVDGMMKGIRFTATSSQLEHEAESRFEVEGLGGRDQHGNFVLTGTVYRHNGGVMLRKLYDNGTVWDWTATMTPFGIVGAWGHDGWGGWLWLWKKEWTSHADTIGY